MFKSCVNCGKDYPQNTGEPKGKYECCCSRECWLEFNGITEEDFHLEINTHKVNLND
ncbi:MAG: hypothetical protein ACOCQR_03465 [bacterium]